MRRRAAIVLCLVFSGLTALVYQIIWARQLGLVFGSTTEAIGTVLGVFFGGLALGNGLAARQLTRVRHPLRVYALLELGVGLFALASLPVLRRLDLLYVWVGVDHSPFLMAALRLVAVAAILLPPTIAMGATLPVVARGIVDCDATRGRWSGILYAANTGGAVLGAYLCGFWLIPALGLTRSVVAAGLLNLAVAAVVLGVAGRWVVTEAPAARAATAEADRGRRSLFLACFAVSGFVAIGYEIVWSKVFGIVMEGTLYGFAAVLTAYLLGVTLGSLAMARRVDRIRDLPGVFALLHAAIAVTVALGMAAVPFLPHLQRRLADLAIGGDAVHLLFALVTPIVLVPTALFGAAFPVLIRIYTDRAGGVGRGMGIATAVNTTGSIAASVVVGFWWIPRLGMDASLYLLVLLDLAVALAVLLQRRVELRAGAGPSRARALGGGVLALLFLSVSFDGVHVERAIAGRQLSQETLDGYREALDRTIASQIFLAEGRTSIVTVYALPGSRLLRTNGLPEAEFRYAPPHYSPGVVHLALLPYLTAGAPRRALVVGLGGGTTVSALTRTALESIDVVELEPAVAEAMKVLHAGRANPLDDPRVRLRINDGRNELLLAAAGGGARYDVIASQPSHPWRVGAANLFTEEFFRLARANLSESGRFSLWVNGFRMDSEALLALFTSFERIFPGSLVVDIAAVPRGAFLLLGGRHPIELDLPTVARRMAEPGVASLLRAFGVRGVEDLLARVEGPTALFAAIRPDAANTDDNAWVETRVPRRLSWPELDFAALEARLPPDAPLLPPCRPHCDGIIAAVATALLERESFGAAPRWPYAGKLERLLRQYAGQLDPFEKATLRAAAALRDPRLEAEGLRSLRELAAAHPEHVTPLRLSATHLERRRDFEAAGEMHAAAFAVSRAVADAFAAGRALHHVDPDRAWRWFQRIPGPRRAEFPDLAFYAAERALEQGAGKDALRGHFESLSQAVREMRGGSGDLPRQLPHGRASRPAGPLGDADPRVYELLSRFAYALGDRRGGRAFADAARRERQRLAHPLLAGAAEALAAGRNGDAAAALEAAETMLPAAPETAELRARLALDRNDPQALEAALSDLRHGAASPRQGIGAENRFRSEHGLPLLSENAAEAPR